MTTRLNRKTYEGPAIGLPEIELFGWIETSSATESKLTCHRHEHSFEICLIHRGRVQWWVQDETYELKRGAVYVTRPGEPHGAVDGVMNPCELYWLILPLQAEHALPGLTVNETHQLFHGLSTLELRTFPSSVGLQRCFRQLHRELLHPDALSGVVARSLLHRLLAQVLRDQEGMLSADHVSGRSRAVERTIQWIALHLVEDISVSDMAKVAGMCASRFHERFLEEVGQTPSEYLSWARILLAKERLADTRKTVSEIAFDLGFSSSQYFATVFRKFVGVSPVQYRSARCTQPVALKEVSAVPAPGFSRHHS